MNIDYEAIARKTNRVHCFNPLGAEQIKSIIEAYEAQKARPEWVPLDLEKVKRGQEVRNKHWPETFLDETFVCLHKDGFITEAYENDFRRRGVNTPDWLMRAPKPKTVRVKVYTRAGAKEPIVVRETFPVSDDCILIGEGDIEVTP